MIQAAQSKNVEPKAAAATPRVNAKAIGKAGKEAEIADPESML